MEFNLELAINAGISHLKVAEIPIFLQPRKGIAKINTFRDGWRSLRMMLLYCPNKVFLLPGFLLLLTGIVGHLLLLTGMVKFPGETAQYITGTGSIIFSVIGFQILNLGLHAKSYSWTRRFEKNPPLERFYDFFTLEVGLIAGVLLIVLGGAILLTMTLQAAGVSRFLSASPGWMSLAATVTIFGFNIVFTSLFISAMSVKKDEDCEKDV